MSEVNVLMDFIMNRTVIQSHKGQIFLDFIVPYNHSVVMLITKMCCLSNYENYFSRIGLLSKVNSLPG